MLTPIPLLSLISIQDRNFQALGWQDGRRLRSRRNISGFGGVGFLSVTTCHRFRGGPVFFVKSPGFCDVRSLSILPVVSISSHGHWKMMYPKQHPPEPKKSDESQLLGFGPKKTLGIGSGV